MRLAADVHDIPMATERLHCMARSPRSVLDDCLVLRGGSLHRTPVKMCELLNAAHMTISSLTHVHGTM